MKTAMKTKTTEEYDKFAELMRQIIKVPHSEIQAKLDAEKKAKERKPKAKQRNAKAGIE
jgi:hypothetical protein